MASSHVMLKHLLLQAKNYILYWYNKKMLTINSSSIKFVQLVQSKPALCFKPFRPSIVMKSEPNKYSSSKLKSTHQPSCHSPPTIQQLYVRYCPPHLMCVPTVPKVGKNEFYNFHQSIFKLILIYFHTAFSLSSPIFTFLQKYTRRK